MEENISTNMHSFLVVHFFQSRDFSPVILTSFSEALERTCLRGSFLASRYVTSIGRRLVEVKS